jgi:tRNA-2-methylthio-N6-dimethylallyladenosine synthase
LHGRTFKTQFLEEEKIVDLVGPDAYKDLPNLCKKWKKAEMQLCDFVKRRNLWGYFARSMSNGITVSITRGCDNMCTFAWYLYPWTGDCSREPQSIMKEIQIYGTRV